MFHQSRLNTSGGDAITSGMVKFFINSAEYRARFGSSTTATPTVGPVTVSGRVLTSDLRGLRNASVSMTDSNGVVRTATTSSFGFFSFADVAGGQAYTFRVASRLFRFGARTVTVTDNLTLPDFIGLE